MPVKPKIVARFAPFSKTKRNETDHAEDGTSHDFGEIKVIKHEDAFIIFRLLCLFGNLFFYCSMNRYSKTIIAIFNFADIFIYIPHLKRWFHDSFLSYVINY